MYKAVRENDNFEIIDGQQRTIFENIHKLFKNFL